MKKSFSDTKVRIYSVTITPSVINPLENLECPPVGDDERHWLEIKFILNTYIFEIGIGFYWVKTDIKKSRLIEMLKEGFKTDKISLLEIDN